MHLFLIKKKKKKAGQSYLPKIPLWNSSVRQFYYITNDSLACVHKVCCVGQEPYPGGKIGAGSTNSLSLIAEYNMTNSYEQWCKKLFLFYKSLPIDLKELAYVAECN